MYATRKNAVEAGRKTSQGFVSSNSKHVDYEYKDTSGGGCWFLFALAILAVAVLFYVSTLM